MTTTQSITTRATERNELLATLAQHRHFLRFTVRDLTDEQARLRTTASELCLGGLIKHVTYVERMWVDFIVRGTDAIPAFGAEDAEQPAHDWGAEFRMLPEQTLAEVLATYEQVAQRTAEVVAGLADLDAGHPLPVAPWFEPGAQWSARRVLLHILAETSQHAGHADILRESLDGAKTMG